MSVALSIAALRIIDNVARSIVNGHPEVTAEIQWKMVAPLERAAAVTIAVAYPTGPAVYGLAIVRMAGKRGRPDWTREQVEAKAVFVRDAARHRLARAVEVRKASRGVVTKITLATTAETTS